MGEAQERPTWGSQGCRAAVSVTFNNLGEAADLERGLWPEGKPLGHHYSVERALPRIMGLLEELGLWSTFFVEGLNAELYPDALLEMADAGHELGYHGCRHEYWPDLGRSDEARSLERGVHKLQEIGVRPRGFRPPGGRLNSSSPGLLEDFGFTHCSPAGIGTGFLGGLAVLPFAWRQIDAYHDMPRFGALRKTFTGSEEPLSPTCFRKTLSAALQSTVRDGGHLTMLFHPFLEDQEDRFRIMREVLEGLRSLVDPAGSFRGVKAPAVPVPTLALKATRRWGTAPSPSPSGIVALGPGATSGVASVLFAECHKTCLRYYQAVITTFPRTCPFSR